MTKMRIQLRGGIEYEQGDINDIICEKNSSWWIGLELEFKNELTPDENDAVAYWKY